MKKFFGSILVFLLMIITPSFAFSDVPEDFWAYDKIQEMYRSGIISGFEDGTFRPNHTITREQASVIITNFFELSEDSDRKFEDVEEHRWSNKYIKNVCEFMPIVGKEEKYYFRPEENATRIEIAETISKVIGLNEEDVNLEILDGFKDKESFAEESKKYIALVAENKIMVGDDKLEFRPNATITRAEFCALIYNIYLIKNDINSSLEDKVVLKVNGEEVTLSEFELYFKLQKKIYESMFGSDEIWSEKIEGKTIYDIVKDATKDGIIANKVKVQKANELNIKLSEQALKELSEYSNSQIGKEICEFYGITIDQLNTINSEGLLIDELAANIYNSIDHSNHSHGDINTLVQNVTYNARHILLSTENSSEEERNRVKTLAESLLERVKNGEDFASLANQYSEDPGSNKNGGLYENIGLGEFVSEFETAALSVENGEIYPEIVESAYGYHIIKLESKINSTRELTSDEKKEIMGVHLEEMSKEWINNSLIEVNEEVYINI